MRTLARSDRGQVRNKGLEILPGESAAGQVAPAAWALAVTLASLSLLAV